MNNIRILGELKFQKIQSKVNDKYMIFLIFHQKFMNNFGILGVDKNFKKIQSKVNDKYMIFHQRFIFNHT